MSIFLNRVQTGRQVASIELGGRSFRLLESRNKNSVTARSVVVAGGPHTPRVDATSYRSAHERSFDIDPIVVRRETGSDRLGKKLGLNVEALIGDVAIDDRFYFETDTKPDIVRELFSDPVLRGALVTAAELFSAVVIGPPGGVVAGVREGPLTLQDQERLGALQRLAGALPAVRARPPKSAIAHAAPVLFGSLLVQVGMGAGVFWTQMCDALVGPVVAIPILVGIAAAFVLSFTVLLLVFRGRANGFRPWLITSLFSIVGMGGICVGLYNDLNHRLDTTTPKRYEAAVVAYRTHINKKQSGLLEVKGLPTSLVPPYGSDGAQEIAYPLMPHPGCKKLELRVGPGYFDNPWVSKVSCIGR